MSDMKPAPTDPSTGSPLLTVAVAAGTYVPQDGVTGKQAITSIRSSLLAPRDPSPLPVTATTWITRFATGHGWTATGTGVVDLNSTEDAGFGFQSVKVTTPAGAAVEDIEHISLGPIDMTGKALVLLAKFDTPAGCQLSVYAGDNPFTNFYLWTQTPRAAGSGWQLYTMAFESASLTGTAVRNAINKVRVRCLGNGAVIRLGGVGYRTINTTAYPNGVMSFCFDDSPIDVFSQARAKMDQYGFPGTAYVITDNIGQASHPTLTQLHEAEDLSGWEVAGHAFTNATHVDYTTLSATALDQELAQLKEWLLTNGFKGADHNAYPFGSVNDTVAAAAAKYFRSGRIVGGGSHPQIFPPAVAPSQLPSRAFDSSFSVASMQAEMDRAKASGQWLINTFHTIGGSTSGANISAADFATIVDYANTIGIAVKTVGAVIRAGV